MDQKNSVEILVVGQPPRYAHPGDAGMDLVSRIECELPPLARQLVPTGLSIALPAGYLGWVTPRSGLAIRHGISMVNAPGIIDAGFRGEIQVVLWNTDATTPFVVRAGDRIAQLVITQHSVARMLEVDSLPGSHRGDGGFGSTGVAGKAGE
ncbi:dUTP pyrophosphatase [Pontimonas salivibrio]|uniref:Deoxyuridine 5'-triphosphate nucleotidohydrolase n=1 Tax=Pontimonas salivibrio TaxID=1159327 RepID=A0A2L2BQG0_9MICO|nr:dUTP diphosphatase [Pontimonas salivibrio]AVG23909.1 dUTP pyrophosphatase [Pontimonas salivibrio]